MERKEKGQENKISVRKDIFKRRDEDENRLVIKTNV